MKTLTNRVGTLAAVVAAVLLPLALAAPANAAPQLDVNLSHSKSVLPPFGDGRLEVLMLNSGDEPTSGPITITVSLPAGMSAASATDGTGFDIWACGIAANRRTVICQGPNLIPSIPPGGETDACVGSGELTNPCPIRIELDVAGDAQKGPAQIQVEACGGSAVPECSAATDTIQIASFGDRFGIAPINDHPQGAANQAPAYPSNYAFWAGTCSVGEAPAPPGFVPPPAPPPPLSMITDPTGFGGIPHSVWVPEDEDESGSFRSGNQFEEPAPRFPSQCIDWGRPAPHGNPDDPTLWREEPPRAGPPGWRLPAVTQAGGRPDGTATFWFRRNEDGFVDGTVDNVYAFLPPGFLGDPNAVPKCTAEQFAVRPLQCPPESQVGVLRLYTLAAGTGGGNYPGSNDEILPVYNLEPRKGRLAEFGVGYASGEDATTVRLTAKARTDGDFGVTALVGQIPAALPLIAQSITIWGVPWAPQHDLWRPPAGWRPLDSESDLDQKGEIPSVGLPETDQVGYDPSWGPVKPMLSNPTECTGGPLQTLLATDSFERQGAFDGEGDPILDLVTPDPDATKTNWHTYASAAPPVTGCEKPGFDADIALEPSSRIADAPSGLAVELTIPQNDDLPFPTPAPDAPQGVVDDYLDAAVAHWRSDAGLATSQLDRAVVELPEGVSVNPSGAAGLEGCSDEQIGVTNASSNPMLFNNGDPFNKDGGADGAECPDGSKIGTVEVETPLLEEPLTGEVVLGTPKSIDPASGQMFRLFVVARAAERGLIAKIAGSTTADPATGRLRTTFDKNPRVAFETMRLQLKAGERGLLALPQQCGGRGWLADFTPWTAAHGAGGVSVADNGAFVADQRCGFGFSPSLAAGTAPRQGGASGSFTLQVARQDGEQWIERLDVELPQGLLAAVRGVPLCTNAQASANACPAGSRIGTLDAAAGSGDPFVLEKKGSVYLTEGYKGAPYGLAVSVPVEAGPFRGQWALPTIVVRQVLHVDRSTAEVTAVSDPLPLIHHGIPLRTRSATVVVDRPGFMRNPTSCAPKQIAAAVFSPQGASATPRQHFQATGCKRLRFKPKLALRLTGRKQMRTGKHPGVRAQVTQRRNQAGIAKAVVRLPKSLALDPENAQALCEFADGTKPDLENHCPKGSIVGRARAVSPLLNRPLSGNVYFVKNVRRDPRTGNEIRTLPMIVVALRGEIAINLEGESSTARNGRLINTFAAVPDAPVSRFNLNIAGGRNGILAVTRTRRARIDICRSRRQIAEADIDGHNGRRADQNVRIKTPCAKKRGAKKQGQRKAKRRARSKG